MGLATDLRHDGWSMWAPWQLSLWVFFCPSPSSLNQHADQNVREWEDTFSELLWRQRPNKAVCQWLQPNPLDLTGISQHHSSPLMNGNLACYYTCTTFSLSFPFRFVWEKKACSRVGAAANGCRIELKVWEWGRKESNLLFQLPLCQFLRKFDLGLEDARRWDRRWRIMKLPLSRTWIRSKSISLKE